MDGLKLALIQMNSKDNARDDNVQRALNYVKQVCTEFKPDIVVLPEFFNTEYFPQYRDYKYLDYAETDQGYTITRMRESAKYHRTYIVAPIYELESPGLIFDTAILIDDQGEIYGKFRKVHPAAVRSLEKIYFAPGNEFPVFNIRGWVVGILICYDNYFPESARCLAVKGAELIVIPFATFNGNEPWEWLHRTRALENGCYVAPCNKVGKEGDWTMGGRSMVVDPFGKVIHEASDENEEILTVELKKEVVHQARNEWPMYRDRRPCCYAPISIPYERVRGLTSGNTTGL